MAVEPTETAWRIQAAVADWTAKADSKASFALTMQSTALAVLGLLTTSTRAAGDLDATVPQVVLWLGVLLMVAGVSCAAWAISPNLSKSDEDQTPTTIFCTSGMSDTWILRFSEQRSGKRTRCRHRPGRWW